MKPSGRRVLGIDQVGTTTWPETILPCLTSSRLKNSTLLAISVVVLLLDALLVAFDTLLLLVCAKLQVSQAATTKQ